MATVSDTVVTILKLQDADFNARVRANERDFTRSKQREAAAAEAAERRIRASNAGLKSALLSTASSLAAAFTVQAVTRVADSYTRFTNQLTVAGLEGGKLANTQEDLYQVAQKYGVELENLGRLYGGLSVLQKDLNTTSADSLGLTTAVAQAIKINGTSSAAAAGSILGLNQALAQTRVQSDEYNQILDGARPLLLAAVQASDRYGGSLAKLKQDIEAGKVSGADLFRILQGGFPILADQAEKASLTIGNSLTVLNNAFGKYIGQADDSLSATERVSAGIKALADNLDVVIPALAVLGVTMAGAFAGRNIDQAVRKVQDNVRASNQAAQATREQAAETSKLAKTQAAQSTARIAELTREAERIQNNIRLTEELLREETNRRNQAQTNKAAGFGGLFVGAGGDSKPVNEAAAAAERQRMQEGLIRSSENLRRVQGELNTETTRAALLTDRATIASRAHQAAIAATSVVARAGAVAVRGLSAALSFFGGPIGVAITVVSIALGALAAEAHGAAQAGEDARATLDRLKAKADETRSASDRLATGQRDQAAAAVQSANSTDTATAAYDRARIAALNAAEAIKYMTIQQRNALLEELQGNRDRLIASTAGSNPFGTNRQEAVNNRRGAAARAAGVNIGDLPSAQDVNTMTGRAARAELERRLPTLTGSDKTAVRDYLNAIATLGAEAETLNETNATIQAVQDRLRDPTVEAPDPVGGDPTGAGDKKKDKGKSAETLANEAEQRRRRTEDVAAEEAMALAQASGDQDRIRALERQSDIRERQRRLIDASTDALVSQDTVQKALTDATAIQERIDAARLEARTRLTAEDRLQSDLAVAQLENDQARVRELERQIELAQLIAKYRQLEYNLVDATRMATEEQVRLDQARADAAQAAIDAQARQDEITLAGMAAQTRAQKEHLKDLQDEEEIRRRIALYTTDGRMSRTDAETRARREVGAIRSAEDDAEARDIYKGYAKVFTDAIRESDDLGDFFRNLGVGLADKLADRFAERLENDIADALEYLVKVIFQQGGGGGGSGGSNVGNWIADGIKAIFGGGRAMGGPVKAGRIYQVNENTPNSELWSPAADGYVHPNKDRPARAGQGSGNSFVLTYAPSIDARGAGPREIDELKAQMERDRRDFDARTTATVNRGMATGRIGQAPYK